MKIRKQKLESLIRNLISEYSGKILKEEDELPGVIIPNPEDVTEYDGIPWDWYKDKGNGYDCHTAALSSGADPSSSEGKSVDVTKLASCKKYRSSNFFDAFGAPRGFQKYSAVFLKGDSNPIGGSLGKWYKLSRQGKDDLIFKITAGDYEDDINIIFAFNSKGELTSDPDWVAYKMYDNKNDYLDSYNTACKIQYKGVDHPTFAYKNPELYKDKTAGYGLDKSGQFSGEKPDEVPTEWASSISQAVQDKIAVKLMTGLGPPSLGGDGARWLWGTVIWAIGQYDHKMLYLKKEDRTPTNWRPMRSVSEMSEEVKERRAPTSFADLPGNLIGGFDVSDPERIVIMTNKKFALSPRIKRVNWSEPGIYDTRAIIQIPGAKIYHGPSHKFRFLGGSRSIGGGFVTRIDNRPMDAEFTVTTALDSEKVSDVLENFEFGPDPINDNNPYRWVDWAFEDTHIEIWINGKDPVTVSQSWGTWSGFTSIILSVGKEVSEGVKNDKNILLERWSKIAGTE